MIDSYAYTSKLLDVPVSFKALLSLITLIFILVTDRILFSLSLFIIIGIAIMAISGLSPKIYYRLCKIPFVFLCIGTVSIAFLFTKTPEGIFTLKFFSGYLVITKESASCAFSVLIKSFACINSLYFLYVTTPIEDILGLMQKMHLPSILQEMTLLILRMIFILISMKENIEIAQKSKLSNLNYRTKLKGVCVLISSIFIKSFIKSEDIYNCMLSRGYQGNMRYTENITPMQNKHKIILVSIVIFLSLFSILLYRVG